jgi:hypothetical protein
VQDRNRSGRPSVLSDDMLASLNAVDISNTWLTLFSDFSFIYFLTNRTCVRNGLRDFSITLHKSQCVYVYLLLGRYLNGLGEWKIFT